jgi:hypothetical protein
VVTVGKQMYMGEQRDRVVNLRALTPEEMGELV